MSTTANTKLSNWHDLRSTVDTRNGVHRVTMETLRELHGAQRVGKHILTQIEEKLSTLGIGHLPSELPNRHNESVLLYALGTPASEVIQAVQTGEATDVAYTWLHRLNTLPNPEDVISKQEVNETLQMTVQTVLTLLQDTQPTPINGDWTRSPVVPKQVDVTEVVRELIPAKQ